MSDLEFRAQNMPGPASYQPDIKQSKGISSVFKPSTKKDLGCLDKVKSDLPDMGTYKVQEALTNKQPVTCKFSKKPNERFNTQAAKSKAFVPGAGNYDVEKCYKALSKIFTKRKR